MKRSAAAIERMDGPARYSAACGCGCRLVRWACDDTRLPCSGAPCGEFFRGEIVDRTGRRDGFGRGLDLRRLVRGDGTLCETAWSISRTRAACMRSRIGCTATVMAKARSSSASPWPRSLSGGWNGSDGEAITRRRRRGEDVGADVGDAVRRTAMASPERQNAEA